MTENKRSRSRRDALRYCAGVAIAGLGPVRPRSAGGGPGPLVVRADEALDEALRLLQDVEPESRQGLSTHAPVKNGDEHAIKFTEALLGEHAIRPDPVYLAAAEDVVARL